MPRNGKKKEAFNQIDVLAKKNMFRHLQLDSSIKQILTLIRDVKHDLYICLIIYYSKKYFLYLLF